MQLRTDEDKRELKSHGSFEFPVHISLESLSRYERGAFAWHWHPEPELTLVLEGKIAYQVNDRTYVLRAGEGLFCNGNAMHTGHMVEGDCTYLSVSFHPRVIYGFENSLLQTRYVDPLLRQPALASIPLRPASPVSSASPAAPDPPASSGWEARILYHLNQIHSLFLDKAEGYELVLTLLLGDIWRLLYENNAPSLPPADDTATRNIQRLKCILSYIQNHYAERITLEEIAGSINICKSECCRFFKRHMKESLFDYLLGYRIEQSLALLADKRLTITEVAVRCGFSNPCYFSKVFRLRMGCTPTQYRSGRP